MKLIRKPEPKNESRTVWEESFAEQIALAAYNTAPVEALVRSVSYYFRNGISGEQLSNVRFLEMGCGAGPNLVWLAQKGVQVSGVDISSTALSLCRENLKRNGLEHKVGGLVEASVDRVPLDDSSFNGIIESCVFQHLAKEARKQAFSEVRRLLKPGGLFVGYMLNADHTIFQKNNTDQLREDPGTLMLDSGGSKVYLSNIGLSHFFRKDEFFDLLEGFSHIDPCSAGYYLPVDEARKRGYTEYFQSMWIVYAIK